MLLLNRAYDHLEEADSNMSRVFLNSWVFLTP